MPLVCYDLLNGLPKHYEERGNKELLRETATATGSTSGEQLSILVDGRSTVVPMTEDVTAAI